MKIGNLSLNLKTAKAVMPVSATKVIGTTFNLENTIEVVAAARSGKISLSLDEINVLTAMVGVFKSPDFNPNVAISGSIEEVAITSKAVNVFQKAVNAYWQKNFASLEIDKVNPEKDVKAIIEYIRDNVCFFLSDNFKVHRNNKGIAPMKSVDYLLTSLTKTMSAMSNIKQQIPASVKDVWEYVEGVLTGIFNFVQKGRENAALYTSKGTHLGFSINEKPSNSFELGKEEFTALAINTQQEYAENSRKYERADVVILFCEELQGKEYSLKKLLSNVTNNILSPTRFGTEEEVIENAIEKENEAFDDSFTGSHRNKYATESIEIPTEKPTKAKK